MRSLTPKDIGALLRDARISAGLTQSQLGEKIGASRFWVAEFERGKPRAELGLALKALRALRLVVTIETKDAVQKREEENTRRNELGDQPTVDLAALLNRTATPTHGRTDLSGTPKVDEWTLFRPVDPTHAEVVEGSNKPRKGRGS